MIFNIHNTDQTSETRLIDTYPNLSKYGYHDEERDLFGYVGKVVINSIEELVSLSKDLNRSLIISNDHDIPLSIEIYDGWRE